jgi:hypothetical protein
MNSDCRDKPPLVWRATAGAAVSRDTDVSSRSIPLHKKLLQPVLPDRAAVAVNFAHTLKEDIGNLLAVEVRPGCRSDPRARASDTLLKHLPGMVLPRP